MKLVSWKCYWLWTRCSEFFTPSRDRPFFFATMPSPPMESTHLLSSEYKNFKLPGHEADQSHASSSEFKNVVVIFSKVCFAVRIVLSGIFSGKGLLGIAIFQISECYP